MRIDLQFGNTQSVEAQKSSRVNSGRAQGSTRPERADEEQFASSTTSLSALAARVLSEPEVRSQRVESLRLAIADGSYTVQPQAIAEAMLRDIF